MDRTSRIFVLFLVILISSLLPSEQISIKEFLTLTYDQKVKLDELKERVISQLPHDYMKDEVYLIRWLRDSFFDVDLAEKKILDNLVWREANNIDNILSEDWSIFDQEYKYTIEGCDREGKPIITSLAGEWDLRRAVVTGQSEKIQRYFARLYEEASTLLRVMQEKHGSNATQFITIMDLSSFSIQTNLCPRCIPLLMSMLSLYQQHYPGLAHKVMAINTPQYALPFWEIFKNLLNPNTKAVFSFHGRNSDKWRKSLLQDVDPSQLTKKFGGTRKTQTIDMDEIRRNGLNFKCFQDY